MDKQDIAWCPGCGNFAILNTINKVITEMNLDRKKLVFVSGIGQAAKTPQYLDVHYFNGLHGRALPVAVGIKLANPSLTVVVESGDGCMYGEGGNHFIHTIRRNSDITTIIHNNMIYGLTKGQASPTSMKGFKNPLQPEGVYMEPFNPLSIAISLNASFVARAFAGDIDTTKEIIKSAVSHKGFSMVDILQPCVTFNKVNTYQWFKEHTYYLEDAYSPDDRPTAFARSLESGKLPLGIFFQSYIPH